MRAPASLVVMFVLALAVPTPGMAQDYYSDIRPVLVENCMGCHVEDGIGWSMEDAEQTFTRHRRIAGMVAVRKMPPWLAEPGHQKYIGDLSLDDEFLGIVASWVEAGYPKGDPRPDPARRSMDRSAFRADVSIDVLAGGSYLPNQSTDDDYRCFVVEWPRQEQGYVTGFRAVPGNLNLAHHAVVFAVEPEMVERYQEIDDLVEGPGFECFGAPLPSSFDWDAYEARYPDGESELDEGQWWLSHWAPGMYGHYFPKGTGILMRPGAGLVVNMHYYTKEARGEPDSGTRLEFEIAETVERPAFHLVQTNADWVESEDNKSMVIPARGMATYIADTSLQSSLWQAADIAGVDEDMITGLEVHSANLHMHAFGHSGDISLTDENGRTETLLSVPEWNLHWQRDFALDKPKVFARSELENTWLRVRCTYQNDTDEVVYGGYGSYDEMCFNFSYVAIQLGKKAAEANGSGPR